MPEKRPPHLSDAMARFRAASQAAVERGRRTAREAKESGTRFDRETKRRTEQLQDPQRDDARPSASELTPTDLRTAAISYRSSAGLPVPEFPSDAELVGPDAEPAVESLPEQAGAAPDEDEDFSQERIMYRL